MLLAMVNPRISKMYLCVSYLPMATEATWLRAEQCQVAGLGVLPLCLAALRSASDKRWCFWKHGD